MSNDRTDTRTDESDEKYDPLDFTAAERAEADTSFVDPDQWTKRDEGAPGAPDAPEEADDE